MKVDRISRTSVSFLLVVVLGVASLGHAGAAEQGDDVARLVSKHASVWRSQPVKTPETFASDGPLLGNGDMKLAIGGPAEALSFYVSKNDLWFLKSGYQVLRSPSFGHLTLKTPALKGAGYTITQSFYDAITTGRFTTKAGTLQMKSYVAATRNLFVVELNSEGAEFELDAGLTVTRRGIARTHSEEQGDVFFASKEFLPQHVDIPSGYAVAWKVLGVKTVLKAQTMKTESFQVQIGREQFQSGRWGFQGAVDDLRVYDRALSAKALGAWVAGKPVADATYVWHADELPATARGVKEIPGKVGKAWQFIGDADCFVDAGRIDMPLTPVTMGGWIRIDGVHKEANYLLSCGTWDKGVSLGLSAGKLRFSVNGRYLESGALPVGKWLHVAGSYDGSRMAIYVDGKNVQTLGRSHIETHFTVKPGQPVTLLMSMDSSFKSKDYKTRVVKALADVSDASDLSRIRKAHSAWWADYWSKSYVEIGEPLVEAAYYRSLYTMGAASRDPGFPPSGIFGWHTTDNPNWGGGYWMNYNQMAPFHGLVSCNRLEQHDPQDTPLLEFMEAGKRFAKTVTKTRGILYPVGIGPMGTDATRTKRHGHRVEGGSIFHQQRSNTAYGAVNMVQRWYATYDPVWGKKVYPYIREVATFWEDYLKFENGRYIIYRDAIHEGSGWNTNPILSLGFVHNIMAVALDMSRELGVDEDRREKWQHIIDHMNGFSLQEREGKTVFRYSEQGTAWYWAGTLGLQQIYPGNSIGLDSHPKLLEVSRNTALMMQRWHDTCGSSSMFPAAVRIGLDPNLILAKLVEYAERSYPNGFQLDNITGIENCSTTPNTINEMLCVSHVSVGKAHIQGQPATKKKQLEGLPHLIRLFPVWPRERDARFVNIRCWGAFLVSSELKGGNVQYVRIKSERGRDCHLLNPWPGEAVVVTRNGKQAETVSGERVKLQTKSGEILRISLSPAIPAARGRGEGTIESAARLTRT